MYSHILYIWLQRHIGIEENIKQYKLDFTLYMKYLSRNKFGLNENNFDKATINCLYKVKGFVEWLFNYLSFYLSQQLLQELSSIDISELTENLFMADSIICVLNVFWVPFIILLEIIKNIIQMSNILIFSFQQNNIMIFNLSRVGVDGAVA